MHAIMPSKVKIPRVALNYMSRVGLGVESLLRAKGALHRQTVLPYIIDCRRHPDEVDLGKGHFIMAFPKPIRALAGVTFLLVVFLLFQAFRSPPIFDEPEKKPSEERKDPLLERSFIMLSTTFQH